MNTMMTPDDRFPHPPRVASECFTRPRAVLVHDPVAAGAVAAMCSAAEPEGIEAGYLFRALPDAAAYAAAHRIMVNLLQEHLGAVFRLQDLVGDRAEFQIASSDPNLVFTRDSAVTLPWAPDASFRTRMRPTLRRAETLVLGAALAGFGLREIVTLPDGVFLEGGDVIPFSREGHRTLLVGYGRRSDWAAIEFLRSALIPRWADEIIAIRLAPWRMNLDSGFLPVTEDVVVSDTRSVVETTRLDATRTEVIDFWSMLSNLGIVVIRVTPEESVGCQACNACCLGDL